MRCARQLQRLVGGHLQVDEDSLLLVYERDDGFVVGFEDASVAYVGPSSTAGRTASRAAA